MQLCLDLCAVYAGVTTSASTFGEGHRYFDLLSMILWETSSSGNDNDAVVGMAGYRQH